MISIAIKLIGRVSPSSYIGEDGEHYVERYLGKERVNLLSGIFDPSFLILLGLVTVRLVVIPLTKRNG